MKRFVYLTLVILLFLMAAGAATAQEPAPEEEGSVYIVQPGDSLGKLARNFLGEENAYLAIVQATNALAEKDFSYRVISDPNIIIVGEKIFIPGLAELPIVQAIQAAAAQTDPAATSPANVVLSGTSWMLTRLNGAAALDQTTVTLDFIDESNAGGSGGCNGYGTSYTFDPNGTAIRFTPPFGTLIACVEPIMAQEQAYFQALTEATSYQLAGDTLLLANAEGVVVAEFTGVSQSLAGTSWEATNYNNGNQAVVGVIADTTLTANFDAEGTISGSAGCNDYFGSYTTDGDTITIGPLASTRKLCPGEGVMEQEAAYLAALETAATYSISGNTMVMRTAEDAMVANFVR